MDSRLFYRTCFELAVALVVTRLSPVRSRSHLASAGRSLAAREPHLTEEAVGEVPHRASRMREAAQRDFGPSLSFGQ